MGLATVDVTPQWPVLAEVDREGRKISDRYRILEATAMAISDQSATIVIVTLDITDICIEVSRQIYDAVKPLGLRPEQIVVNSSHTHSAPAVCPTDVAEPNVLDVEYQHFLVNKIVSAIKLALKDMRPATLGTAEATCSVCVNRDARPHLLYDLNPDPKGPIDRRVRLLVVKDPKDDGLRAVLALFGCHPSDVDQMKAWGGDFFGFARDEMARLYPGVVVLTAQGMGGDVRLNHLRTDYPDLFDTTYLTDLGPNKEYGRQLALSIKEGLRKPLVPVRGRIRAAMTEVHLPMQDAPPREVAEMATMGFDPYSKRQHDNDYYVKRWGRFLLSSYYDKNVPVPHLLDRPYAMRAIHIGEDFTLAALDGETFVCIGRQIEEVLSPPGSPGRTYVFGYSNDVNAYIPCGENFRPEGDGFEINTHWWWIQPAKFHPSIDEVIVQATVDLARRP